MSKRFKGESKNGKNPIEKITLCNPVADMAVSPPLPDAIPLDKEEITTLKETEDKITKLKLAIADLTMESERARENLITALNSLTKANEEFIGQARTIATAHGVDVDDPAKGRWSLDTQTMVLSRVVA
jgi:hypothetical protein